MRCYIVCWQRKYSRQYTVAQSAEHAFILFIEALRYHSIIVSANDLSPIWRQTVIWTNSRLLHIIPLENVNLRNLNSIAAIFIQENKSKFVWKIVGHFVSATMS